MIYPLKTHENTVVKHEYRSYALVFLKIVMTTLVCHTQFWLKKIKIIWQKTVSPESYCVLARNDYEHYLVENSISGVTLLYQINDGEHYLPIKSILDLVCFTKQTMTTAIVSPN